jgi:hypothetical protein
MPGDRNISFEVTKEKLVLEKPMHIPSFAL